MQAGYRECGSCGSVNTRRVAAVSRVEGARESLVWVRWECRVCGRSSERHLAPVLLRSESSLNCGA